MKRATLASFLNLLPRMVLVGAAQEYFCFAYARHSDFAQMMSFEKSDPFVESSLSNHFEASRRPGKINSVPNSTTKTC